MLCAVISSWKSLVMRSAALTCLSLEGESLKGLVLVERCCAETGKVSWGLVEDLDLARLVVVAPTLTAGLLALSSSFCASSFCFSLTSQTIGRTLPFSSVTIFLVVYNFFTQGLFCLGIAPVDCLVEVLRCCSDLTGGVFEDVGGASLLFNDVFGIVIVREGALAVWGGDEEQFEVTFL